MASGRFERLMEKLKKRKKVRNPKKLTAWILRRSGKCK